MTRGLLLLLAVVEMALGIAGLVGATWLLVSHNAGMVLIFWPLFAAIGLLLVAGAAIFVRRPWSYYLHIAIIVLIGLLVTVYVGPLMGPNGWIEVLIQAAIVVVPLTLLFLLPPVRSYFGVSR